jgi:uncharacterized protein YfkK (UPF0435 family)
MEHAKMVVGRLFLTNSIASLQFNQLLEITLGALQMINQQVVTQLQAYVVAPETLRLHYGLLKHSSSLSPLAIVAHLVGLVFAARRRYSIKQSQLEHAKIIAGRQFSTNSSASLQSRYILEIILGALQMINQQVVTQLQIPAGYVVAPDMVTLH